MKKALLSSIAALLMPTFLLANKLIPREKFFQLPSCMAIKISPNGEKLAYVGADDHGIMNLFVSSNLSLESGQKLTHFKEPRIKSFRWSPKGDKILLLKDTNGTGQYHLYCIDLASSVLYRNNLQNRDSAKNCEVKSTLSEIDSSGCFSIKNLTAGFGNCDTKIFQFSTSKHKAIIGIKHRHPQFHDLYLFDFENESLTLYFENDHFIDFVFDEDLAIALKIQMNQDSSLTVFDKNHQSLISLKAEDAFHTEWLQYNREDNSLYLLDNRGCNTTQLKKISLDQTQPDLLLGHDDQSDIQDILFEKSKPIAYATNYTQKKWHALNADIQTDLDLLTAQLGSNFSITSQSNNHLLWIVNNVIPEKGSEFWLYRRSSQSLSLLFSSPKLGHLAKMYPLLIPSSDGKELVCYLTIPRNEDQGGKTKNPLPLVVIPHGGPFKGRDTYTYSPFHQWLANRGYAVLSVNFRLSSGFGKEFVTAGNREWGGKAHQDILDAVDWCVQAGLADKERLSILGSSYGGYEALASLTFSPDVFSCAISACGPSNLKTVLNSIPFYWELSSAPLSDSMRFYTKNAFITSIGGDPSKESDIPFLESCSPLNYVDKIQKPLLLVHGANDPIVAIAESDRIFDVMEQKNLPVVYLSFPDEGHGINKLENLLCELAYSEWLLATFLGGAFEPFSEDLLNKSSVKIRASSMNPSHLLFPAKEE
jgi:dipeptidyl aminopeptidase/acylaminoacyl peptidase